MIPAKVVALDVATNTPQGALTLTGVQDLLPAAYSNGFAFFGSLDAPAKISKIDTTNFVVVGATLTLNPGEDNAYGVANDGAFAYFGLYTQPGIMVKIR